MANARDIVEQFFSAFYRGDDQTARQYLADDLSFSGPAATFSTADEYLKVSGHVGRMAKGVERRKVFVDGPDVCIFFDLVIDTPVRSMTIAEWYHVDSDRISSIRMIFDTGPFTAGAAKPSDETAIDPVCQMTVEKAAAAATRNYEGTTYYFCNPGCADAFEQAPERYLAISR